MTNINKTIELIEKGMTVSQALKEVYKTRKLSIPFEDGDFDVEIQSLGFSTRTSNAILRTGARTLQDIIDYINTNGWRRISNFGQSAGTELYEKILDVAWDQMNGERRAALLFDVDLHNEAK